MEEFSLDKISVKIHYGKTRTYFEEVLSSYHNGNYRSAVVMLWSVAVCDIVYKLQNLIDLYSDSAAREILDQMAVLQEANPTSSAWEVKLLDETFNKTNLLNSAEYEDLRYIQKQRHLSAHPVLNHNRELFTPNKETVRSLLRNALEGLLIKPPFYAQRIFKELLDDIAENSLALNTRKKVKRYIESRYLTRMTTDVELTIYRSLWKIIFKLDNEECIKYRHINLQVFEVISERNKEGLTDLIRGDIDYYSNIAPTGMPLAYLAYYLSKNHTLYELLSEDAKLKLQHCIDTDEIGKTVGWFVKESLHTHYEDLMIWLKSDEHPTFSEDQWKYLLELSDTEEWQECFSKLAATSYTVSLNYEEADKRFIEDIQPYLHLFNIDAFTFLLSKIENNNQTYSRWRSSLEHPYIQTKILSLSDDFDFSLYPYFSRTIEVETEEES